MDKKVVVAGVNALKCHCKDGTVFVPVTMKEIAEIRTHDSLKMSGECTHGHTYSFLAVPSLGTMTVVTKLAE